MCSLRFLGPISVGALLACGTSPVAPAQPPLTVEIVMPPCENPAPLFGHFDARAPGYIVDLRDGVDVAGETNRLAAKYGFAPTHVYTHVLGGFSADLTPKIVAALRCEVTLNFIEFNQLFTLD